MLSITATCEVQCDEEEGSLGPKTKSRSRGGAIVGTGRSWRPQRGRVKIIKPPQSSCVIFVWCALRYCIQAKGLWQCPQSRFTGLVGLHPQRADSLQECPPESCKAIFDAHVRIEPPLTLTGRASGGIKLLADLIAR